MNRFVWAVLGGALLLVLPVGATTTTYQFDFAACGDAGNPSCTSNVSAYAVSSSGVTATATAYFLEGNSNAFNSGAAFQTGQVGAYSDAGLGICETQSGGNCGVPYHQIDNYNNPGGNSSPADFEFMLIQFSAAVNLSSIQLGNWGVASGNNDPFYATYLVSSSSNAISLAGTTYSQLTSGTDGFSAAVTTSCTSGVTLEDGSNGSGGSTTSNCAVNGNAVDNLNGTGVTYLLLGASTTQNVNEDFFKIQDINANHGTGGGQGPAPTPEPATFALFGFALIGLGIFGRKSKTNKYDPSCGASSAGRNFGCGPFFFARPDL